MKRPNAIWLILLAATISLCVCYQPAPRYASTPRLKVENDGRIISGIKPATAALAYDPYFTHVNDTPHIQILAARMTGGVK